MARKRSIDPGIWSDQGFLEMSLPARILFVFLISFADDEGRGHASAKTIRHQVFPDEAYEDGKIADLKAEIARNVRCTFYTVDGREYYQLLRWKQYQKVKYPSASTIPPMPTTEEDSPNPSETLPEDSGNVPEMMEDGFPQRELRELSELREGQPVALQARHGLAEREEKIFADDAATGPALVAVPYKEPLQLTKEFFDSLGPGDLNAIALSDDPEAKRFIHWVTRDVLPSIRKTGGYAFPFGITIPSQNAKEPMQNERGQDDDLDDIF